MAVGWFDGDYVLVVFPADFQLGDGAGVVAFALQFFGSLGVFVVVEVGVGIVAVFFGMAFENFAVLLQAVAVEVNDLRQRLRDGRRWPGESGGQDEAEPGEEG